MTIANLCENCEVRRITKNSISLDDRAASMHTSIYLPLSLFPFHPRFISLASDNRADAIRAEPHRHAGNTDVPLCNRSLIVS